MCLTLKRRSWAWSQSISARQLERRQLLKCSYFLIGVPGDPRYQWWDRICAALRYFYSQNARGDQRFSGIWNLIGKTFVVNKVAGGGILHCCHAMTQRGGTELQNTSKHSRFFSSWIKVIVEAKESLLFRPVGICVKRHFTSAWCLVVDLIHLLLN